MKKSGFTMIELIFVIVILGVLAAVAIPKLNATRDDAEQAKAMTNLATLMGDLASYYTAQGTFAANIGSMTNVPLSVDKNDQTKADFKIKDKTCLTFAVNKTNGTLSVTSPESSPNPVCNSLITNTSTQNILSGSYICKGDFTVAGPDGNKTVGYKDKESGAKDTDVGMNGACEQAAKDMGTVANDATNPTSVGVPAKMDKFGKEIIMNFQGGGVAF